MNLEPINSDNFQKEVIQSERPMLVEFGAVWCAPCKRLEPEMDKLKTAWGEKIRMGKIDVDESTDLTMEYNVMSVPTLIFFNQGQEKQRVIGFVPLAKLIEKFEPYI